MDWSRGLDSWIEAMEWSRFLEWNLGVKCWSVREND